MGIAAELVIEWVGNAAERLFGPGIAGRLRGVLPDLPPEPVFQDLYRYGEGPGLFRELHFAEDVTRYVMAESLWCDFEAFYRAPQALSWWLITGKAGSGKSRAAFEFCKALETGTLHSDGFVSDVKPVVGENFSTWKAGFLDLAATPFSTWKTWHPRHHTLLVLDNVTRHYNARHAAGQDVGDIGDIGDIGQNRFDIPEIISLLAQRAVKGDFGSFRVRLLLLEREYREADGEGATLDWFDALPKYLSLPFKEGATPLPPVSPDGLFRIARDVWESIGLGNPDAPYAVPRVFLEKLRVIDAERRPLYAMLLAACVTANNDPEVTRRDVLDCALWDEHEYMLQPAEVESTPQALKALAVSILTSGKAGSCRLDGGHALRQSGMGFAGCDEGMFHFYPVEPDLLGEYFVLEGVGRDDILGAASVSDADMRTLIHKAWEMHPAEVEGFFVRCGQDFSSEPGWIEKRFLLDRQMADASAPLKLRYVRTALGLMARLDKEEIEAARGIFECLNTLGKAGLFRRERARASVCLIRICCRAGMLDEASSVLQGMRGLGESEEVQVCRVDASACLIEGLCRIGELVRARVMYEGALAFETSEETLPFKVCALHSLINAYGKTGEFAEARAMLESLAACGDSEDSQVHCANASVNLVVLYGKAGHLEEARGVFESMLALGSAPEVRDACAKASKFLGFFTTARAAGEESGQVLTAA